MEHLQPVFGVHHFRMVLHGIEFLIRIFHGGYRTVGGVGCDGKALRQTVDVVGMAHPGNALFRQTGKQQAGSVELRFGFTILAGNGAGHTPTQGICHQLTAVANTQNRDVLFKNILFDVGGFLQINAVGPAGEDDPFGIHGQQFSQWSFIGLDFAVHPAFTHPACNELVILSAKIQYNHGFVGHGVPPAFFLVGV